MRRIALSLLFKIWASPYSLLGLSLGLLGWISGGQKKIERGCIEFSGGFLTTLLQWMPTGSGALAMTLGHTILGQNEHALEISRDHEHVHVRQYERWGPLFGPAYLLCSAWMWCVGKDPYRDNPFEVEAYAVATPQRMSDDKNIF